MASPANSGHAAATISASSPAGSAISSARRAVPGGRAAIHAHAALAASPSIPPKPSATSGAALFTVRMKRRTKMFS